MASFFHGVNHIHTIGNMAENDMLAIEMRRGFEIDEELRAIRVGARIGHREHSASSVAFHEILVGELHAVNRLAAGTVAIGEVTTLRHEPGDDAVER